MSETRSVRVRISGRVQGVGFRAWTEDEAIALGLSGWVGNTTSGAVEAVFAGPTEQVERMLARCREGPRLARVDCVEIISESTLVSGPFIIRR